jgi:acyl-coenzyme A thioesterase PaaI-like protein
MPSPVRHPPADPGYAERCRASFGRQAAMRLIGGRLARAGHTLTVAKADVFDENGAHVAAMQQTLMMLADIPDVPDTPA